MCRISTSDLTRAHSGRFCHVSEMLMYIGGEMNDNFSRWCLLEAEKGNPVSIKN